MQPKFRFHVFACQNQRPEGHLRGCCLSKGSDRILNYLKARVKELHLEGIRINKAGCMDQCEKGPAVVVYPEGTWYTLKSVEDAEDFLQQHLIQRQKAENLLMK